MVDAPEFRDSASAVMRPLAEALGDLLPDDTDFVLIVVRRAAGGGWCSFATSLEPYEVPSLLEVSKKQAEQRLKDEPRT